MLSAVGFLEPAFLWGLLFLGVVLLVHLLKRPRTIRLAFSTLRFFDASVVASSRSRKLRKLLLLLVRLLIVALLVTLFAHPYDRHDALRCIGDRQSDLFVWIDPTPSMTFTEDGVSIGRRARNLVDSIAAYRNNGAGVYLYDHERGTFTGYAGEEEQSSPIRYGIDGAALGCAFTAAAHTSKRPSFLLMSDFQTTTGTQVGMARAALARSSIPVIACPVIPKEPWNVAVENVSAGSDREGIAAARLRVYGDRKFSGTIGVTVNNRRMPAVPCTLAAGSDTVLLLPVRREDRDQWGTVTLAGADPLNFDNTGSFVFGRTTGFRVLIAGDEIANMPIAAALRAADTRRWDPVCLAPGKLTPAICDSADIIVVNECSSIPASLRVLMAARGPRPQAWVVAAAAGDATAARTAARLLEPFSRTVGMVPMTPPGGINLPDTVSGMWREFPAMRIDEVTISRFAAGLTGDVLCRLSNGKPAVVAAADALRRTWLIAATPLGVSTDNNLCETGFYVPFIDRLFRKAASGLDAGGRGAWIAGASVKNPWYGASGAAQLSRTDGTVLLRLQQQPVVTVDAPGVYLVTPPAAAPYPQVVVADTLESVPEYRLPENGKDGKWTVALPHELTAYLQGHGRPVFWILPWLLLALLLCAEVLLRERRGGQVS
jgi:hypothetical protein